MMDDIEARAQHAEEQARQSEEQARQQARVAVLDLAEVYGVEITQERAQQVE